MKNLFLKSLIMFLIIVAYGCQLNDVDSTEPETLFKTTPISDKRTSLMVSNWLDQKSIQNSFRIGSTTSLTFNFDDLSQTIQRDSEIKTIVAKQVGYDESASVNYSLGFYELNNEIAQALIVKIDNRKAGFKLIEYYDLDSNIKAAVELNLNTKATTIINLKNVNNGKTMCGQAVADCIGDTYTNQGWLSVALVVGSVFYPGVTLSVAAACTVQKCAIE